MQKNKLNLHIYGIHLLNPYKTVVSHLKCVPHVQHDYFSPFNQSDHCFLALSLPLKSLLKLLIQLIVIAISFDFPRSQHYWFGIFS